MERSLSAGKNKRSGFLLKRIKAYRNKLREIAMHLSSRPEEWGKFQSELNQEVTAVFHELMNFEKECAAKGNGLMCDKVKFFFIKRLRKYFMHGEFIRRSYEKPYGYAGDFKIIDDIYENLPKTDGLDRVFDNYFLTCAASVATRNRKDDFRRMLSAWIKVKNASFDILNIASGPCREIVELAHSDLDLKDVHFTCVDNEQEALSYAGKFFDKEKVNIKFIKMNVARLALAKNLMSKLQSQFDLIYSTGLFDYLNERIAVRLIKNLKSVLKPSGSMIISNYRDEYSNPSLHFMELVGDWKLVYRTEDEFKKIFVQAGFKPSQLSIKYEQQGVMQYCVAKNT